MPLYKVVLLSKTAKLYLWKITEDLSELRSQIRLKNSSIARLESMKSESHQKGFLAVRMLLQHNEYDDFDLYYDAFGKPHIKPQGCFVKDVEISISHSNDFSAIVISQEKVGLDLEQIKDKTLRIAPRFMDVSHLDNLSKEEKIKKATVIWGIKESIFKIKNEQGISFPNHIFEDDFSLEEKKSKAILKFNNREEVFNIIFDSIEDYIYVCAFEEKT
jgi:phosphopantetheinyl transferase